MESRLFNLIFCWTLIASMPCWGVEAVLPGSSSKPSQASPAQAKCDCQCEYDKGGECARFRETLPEQDRWKVAACQDDASSLNSAYTLLKGCSFGAAEFGVDTIVGFLNFPEIVDGVKTYGDTCNKSKMAKVDLLRGVTQAYSEPQGDAKESMLDIMIEKWSCADIAREAQNRANSYAAAIDAKRLAIRDEFELHGKVLNTDDPEIESKLQSKLTAGEKEYLASVKRPKLFRCYTPFAKAEMVCNSLIEAATVLAGGYGVGRLGLLKEAAEARRLVQAAEAARRDHEIEVIMRSNLHTDMIVGDKAYNLNNMLRLPGMGLVENLYMKLRKAPRETFYVDDASVTNAGIENGWQVIRTRIAVTKEEFADIQSQLTKSEGNPGGYSTCISGVCRILRKNHIISVPIGLSQSPAAVAAYFYITRTLGSTRVLSVQMVNMTGKGLASMAASEAAVFAYGTGSYYLIDYLDAKTNKPAVMAVKIDGE